MKLPFRNITLQKKFPFFTALLLGLAVVPINLTGWGLDYFPGDIGDSRFNLYILEHGYKFLTGQISDYWNAPFMYPEPNVISYSDNLLGTVPLYGLFRLLGFKIFTAFQLWFISLFVLNYTCFYFFAKWLFKNRYAATVGAFVFAFSLANQAAMPHVQIMPRFFIPLAFWMILRFGEDFKPRYLFLSIFFITAELYTSIYLGLLTFLSGGFLLLLISFSNLKKLISNFRVPLWWIRISIGLLFNLALIYGLMYPYIERSETQPPAPYPEILQSIPTPISYIYSKSGSLFWNFLSEIGNKLPFSYNQQLFPGGIAFLSFLVLLGFFALRIRKLSKPIILLFSTALTIILFLYVLANLPFMSLYICYLVTIACAQWTES